MAEVTGDQAKWTEQSSNEKKGLHYFVKFFLGFLVVVKVQYDQFCIFCPISAPHSAD